MEFREVVTNMGQVEKGISYSERITIIAAKIFGTPDEDLSIEIPFEGELTMDIDRIPEGEAKKTEFKEHRGRQWGPSPEDPHRSFPAVKIGDLYMIWIKGRHEWVGIKYIDKGTTFEGAWYGIDENIDTSGPYKLNRECARLILSAYNNTEVLEDYVLHTSPAELEGLQP